MGARGALQRADAGGVLGGMRARGHTASVAHRHEFARRGYEIAPIRHTSRNGLCVDSRARIEHRVELVRLFVA